MNSLACILDLTYVVLPILNALVVLDDISLRWVHIFYCQALR